MIMILWVLIVSLLIRIAGSSEDGTESNGIWMSTPEMIRALGYPCEEHRIVTGDGYVLENYRIPWGRGKTSASPRSAVPVLLVHGMFTSSKDFLLLGTRSLGYKLADAGYDVWLTNMRFTEAASHRNVTKDDASYWDFGLVEHALHDVAASVEHVSGATSADAIAYVGYSLGGSVLYAMLCDERPELRARIAAFVALAPPYFNEHLVPALRLVHRLGVLDALMKYGFNHFAASERMRRFAVDVLCNARNRDEDLCYSLLFWITGEDWEQVDWANTATIFGRYMAVTAKQLSHYVQYVSTGVLSKYDYGPEENLRRYGTRKPPAYNMNSCTAPAVIYYGENDMITSKRDIMKMARAMRGNRSAEVRVRRPKSKTFNHIDFIASLNASDYLYRDVIRTLETLLRR